MIVITKKEKGKMLFKRKKKMKRTSSWRKIEKKGIFHSVPI